MAQFAAASFDGTDGVELSIADSNFTKHPSATGDAEIKSNRVCTASDVVGLYYHSGTPINANYTVDSDLYVVSNTHYTGVVGRVNTSANTFYMWRYFVSATAFQLYKAVAGSFTQLGSNSTASLSVASTYVLQLKMDGNQIEGLVDTVSKVGPISDSAITAAGKAGIRVDTNSTTNGYHLNDFHADDIVAAGGTTLHQTTNYQGMNRMNGAMR